MAIIDSLARIKELTVKLFTGNTPILSNNKFFSPTNIDRSQYITLHIDPNSLANLYKEKGVKEELTRKIQQYIAEGGDYAFLNKENVNNINQIGRVIYDRSQASILNFINTVIPISDRGLWISGLALRNVRGEEISRIKMDMIYTAGHRGKNIANLCTSQYLESKIIPLYKELTEVSRKEGVDDFLSSYERIVNYPVFAVFVGEIQSKEEVLQEIKTKIGILLKDSSQNQLDIHGINSSNANKIKALLPDIFEEYKSDILRHSIQDRVGFIKVEIILRKDDASD